MAVLTGDLVGSTGLKHGDLLGVRQALEDAAGQIAGWGRGRVHGPDFFRGDSWQLVLEESGLYLRAAIYLRTAVLALEPAVDTRISIGVGQVEALDEAYVSRSIGEAFTLSGRSLDDMSRLDVFSLNVAKPAPSLMLMPVVLSFCSHVVGEWSPSQARAALEALKPGARTQGDVAEALGITRQAVNKTYLRSGLPSVLLAIEAFETLDPGANA